MRIEMDGNEREENAKYLVRFNGIHTERGRKNKSNEKITKIKQF